MVLNIIFVGLTDQAGKSAHLSNNYSSNNSKEGAPSSIFAYFKCNWGDLKEKANRKGWRYFNSLTWRKATAVLSDLTRDDSMTFFGKSDL